MVKISFICWGNRTSTFSECPTYFITYSYKAFLTTSGNRTHHLCGHRPDCIDRNKCNYIVPCHTMGPRYLLIEKFSSRHSQFFFAITFGVFIARIVIKLFASDFRRYFCLTHAVSCTNKTSHNDIAKILLPAVLKIQVT